MITEVAALSIIWIVYARVLMLITRVMGAVYSIITADLLSVFTLSRSIALIWGTGLAAERSAKVTVLT